MRKESKMMSSFPVIFFSNDATVATKGFPPELKSTNILEKVSATKDIEA
jgi:hypothetical protein